PSPRWLKIGLSLLPLWLILSAGVAIWLSQRNDAKEEKEQQQRFARGMSVENIADDLRKLDSVIGQRHAGDAEALANLNRAASMIDGVLGPSNTGYQVERMAIAGSPPVLRATLHGKEDKLPALWLLCAYDTPADQSGAGSSHAVAAAIAAAQAMAQDAAPRTLELIFVPHGNAATGSVEACLKPLQVKLERPSMVICLGDFSHGADLLVESGSESRPLLDALSGLGQWRAPNGESSRLVSACSSAGLPVIEVRSHAANPARSEAPPAETLAVSAGKLVEWLRRCSNIPPTP
ncbi:MAG TPA: hypothetical protein VFY13_05505, partial [Luteolibacter sp.]|nr:hypothetical protein [Luteolibacter sp.]